jgi:hypothetical protein
MLLGKLVAQLHYLRRCLGRVSSFLKYSSWCRRGIINAVLPYFLWYIQTGGWFHTEVARDEKRIYLFLTSKRHVSKTKHFHVLWNLVTCVSYCRTWHKVMTVSTSQTSWHWKVNEKYLLLLLFTNYRSFGTVLLMRPNEAYHQWQLDGSLDISTNKNNSPTTKRGTLLWILFNRSTLGGSDGRYQLRLFTVLVRIGHVARMGEERRVYRVLVGKPEGIINYKYYIIYYIIYYK